MDQRATQLPPNSKPFSLVIAQSHKPWPPFRQQLVLWQLAPSASSESGSHTPTDTSAASLFAPGSETMHTALPIPAAIYAGIK